MPYLERTKPRRIGSLASLFCLMMLVIQPVAAQDSSIDTLERAQELLGSGSYQAAVEVFGLVSDPFHEAEVARGEARALAAMGQYEEAIEHLQSRLEDGDYASQAAVATQLAELYRMTGDSARAVTVLTDLIGQHSDPPVRALVQYGDVLQFVGRGDEAVPYFNRAIARYDSGQVFESGDVAMVALANWRLGRFHEANALFSEAVSIDDRNVEAQVLWGNLFQEKFNDADAERSYNEALEVNRRYTPALVGLAGVSAPERNVQRALDINPRDVAALETYGRLLVRNDREEEGRRFLEQALAINPEAVDALATLATLAVMQEDMARYEALESRVADFSPDNPAFYTLIAELLGHNYRFAEAVEFARKAVEADPRYWRGHTVLGNNLVRLGEEEEGREHLELAFANDPFNVLTSNLLQLFDTLDDFATLESEHFRVNMSHSDALVLWPYMEPFLEESWDHLVEKYRFEPEVPVIFQVFENRQDFAVRSVGLPDIGPLVGICFGRVVTLISPDELSANWQEIFWHELVHVFTLQMTENRMPRWLSEGISTWEERELRPEWGRRQGMELVRAVNEDRLLPVARLNEGFTGARSNADLGFAYYQSYLVVEYIAEQHGFEKLLELIHEYAEVRENSERFRNVFDMDLEQFDAGFREWVHQRVDDMNLYVHSDDDPDESTGHGHGVRENNSAVMAELYNSASLKRYMRNRIENNPRDFQAHMQLGVVLFREESFQEALEHLRAAHDILPDYSGSPSPPLIKAQIHQALEDREAYLEQLEVLLENQQHDYSSAMVLAEDALDKGDLERARYYVDRAMAVNPYRLDVHRVAAELARLQQDTGQMVKEYEILAQLDRNDPVDARTNLAEAYLEDAQPDQARMSVLRALEIAPGYERAQQVLLQAVETGE